MQTVSVVDNPAYGSVALSLDGSFVYTPDTGFVGSDSFTYVANDSLVDSRIATVSITVNATDPPATGTRFYVVDFTNRATFEYDTNGGLVETYGLPDTNRKPKGVASNADGSLVWTIDKSTTFAWTWAMNLVFDKVGRLSEARLYFVRQIDFGFAFDFEKNDGWANCQRAGRVRVVIQNQPIGTNSIEQCNLWLPTLDARFVGQLLESRMPHTQDCLNRSG